MKLIEGMKLKQKQSTVTKVTVGTNESSRQSDAEWISELKKSPAYQGIDIDREHAKMVEWCRVKKKQPTRQRFVNWLNRTEVPLLKTTSRPPEKLRDVPPDFPIWFIEAHEDRRDELARWSSWNRIPFLLQQEYLKWRAAKANPA